MRILITNDDSISSSVLAPLAQWASKLGEVTVVVPKVEQSGKSHGIELHKAFEVLKTDRIPGIEAYTVDSTPADCLRYAVFGMKRTYDLVISGINRGLNMGQDIMYSGTAGAIFEAAAMGIPAVAVSTDPNSFDSALAHLDTVEDFFRKHDLLSKNRLYNVNIPLEVKGIRITRQGGPYFSDDFDNLGDNMYRAHGKCVYQDSGDLELDTDATLHGYISISPMTCNRVNMDVFRELRKLN